MWEIYPCRTREWWTRDYASGRCPHSFLLFSRNYTALLISHTWIAFLSRTHGLSLRQPTSSSTILVQLAWTYPCETGTQLLPNPDAGKPYMSKSLWWVLNGLAVAPPAMEFIIAVTFRLSALSSKIRHYLRVSTSTKLLSSSFWECKLGIHCGR